MNARTTCAPRVRAAATVAVLAAAALSLTACGSDSDAAGSSSGDNAASSIQGEYYSDDGQLVIKDSAVTFYPFGCPPDSSPKPGDKAVIETEPDGQGQLSDDMTQVVWNSDDEDVNDDTMDTTTPISLTSAGKTKVVTVAGDEVFRSGDKATAVSSYDGMC